MKFIISLLFTLVTSTSFANSNSIARLLEANKGIYYGKSSSGVCTVLVNFVSFSRGLPGDPTYSYYEVGATNGKFTFDEMEIQTSVKHTDLKVSKGALTGYAYSSSTGYGSTKGKKITIFFNSQKQISSVEVKEVLGGPYKCALR